MVGPLSSFAVDLKWNTFIMHCEKLIRPVAPMQWHTQVSELYIISGSCIVPIPSSHPMSETRIASQILHDSAMKGYVILSVVGMESHNLFLFSSKISLKHWKSCPVWRDLATKSFHGQDFQGGVTWLLFTFCSCCSIISAMLALSPCLIQFLNPFASTCAHPCG